MMDKNSLVALLCDLKCENLKEYQDEDLLQQKLSKTYEKLLITHADVQNTLPELQGFISQKQSLQWQLLSLSFYILKLLNNLLSPLDDELLSVQQTKTIRICLEDLVALGILTNLRPNMPFYIKFEGPNHSNDVVFTYSVLKCSILILCGFIKMPDLRLLVLPDSLQAILVGLYQIAYCPLIKPNKTDVASGFTMTDSLYGILVEDQSHFKALLDNLSINIHPGIFVKETMIIFHENSPIWFKKAVSQTLTNIMKSKNGVENIARAILDGTTDDTTRNWQSFEVITKLLLTCKKFPNFNDTIAKNIIKLLDHSQDNVLIFERLFTYFTKSLYPIDPNFCKDVFVRRVIQFFLQFAVKEFRVNNDIASDLKQSTRILHDLFHLKTGNTKKLPLEILKPILNVLFRFYCLTLKTNLKTTNNELKNLLMDAFKYKNFVQFQLLDSCVFDLTVQGIIQFRKDFQVKITEDCVTVTVVPESVTYSVTENVECTMELLKNQYDAMVVLFGYFLNCLTERDKYFKRGNDSLLKLEGQEIMSDYIERSLIVYKSLSDLANNAKIQENITEKPESIIKYIRSVLMKSIELGTHRSKDHDSEGYQSLFTIVMILQALIGDCRLEQHQELVELLSRIRDECFNKELKDLIGAILVKEKGERKPTRYKVKEKTELEAAMEDVCSSMLPVRGHGLMTLRKLIERKDEETLGKKQFIMNIFQQNLKNDDSYIYLSAIRGLAAMTDMFPDTILNLLCEEYADFTSKDDDDGHEMRMKIGEVLVQVTKLLGDMAPKYKSLLLNTFLNASRDEDHLIRASSLSNLGEICRVLGYKLGTIVTEVLVCVHAIISTDKAPEARRAAVTVIRQLFLGLDSEMIAFLKDDILPIYRTLKQIYNNDKDDVMRLQAQLALEELNENMKQFVFPVPQLNNDKNIIMLN